MLSLETVQLLKAVARVILVLGLVLGVSGVVPQAHARADSAHPRGLRATSSPTALEYVYIEALRPAAGTVLTQGRARSVVAVRGHHAHDGVIAAPVRVPPSGFSAAFVQRGRAPWRVASLVSAPLRGPPTTI